MAMFVSKERVIRDGHLIAFEGEEMTDEEAVNRGLVNACAIEPEEDPEGSLDDLTVPQLKEIAEREGVEIPAKAKKAEIIQAIEGEAQDEDLYEDDEEEG